MPPFNTHIPIVKLIHALLALRPSRPRWLRPTHHAYHLIRHRQVSINSGRKWMDQSRPVMIPKPKHSTTIWTEVTLRRTKFFIGCSTIFDGAIFSMRLVSDRFILWGPWFWTIDELAPTLGWNLVHTWWGLDPWALSGCRLCRLDSLPRCTRLLCGKCYRRIIGKGLVFVIEE